jgi:hypothetical protein
VLGSVIAASAHLESIMTREESIPAEESNAATGGKATVDNGPTASVDAAGGDAPEHLKTNSDQVEEYRPGRGATERAERKLGQSEQWQTSPYAFAERGAVTHSVADFLKRVNDVKEQDVLPDVIGAGVTVVAGPPGVRKGPFVRDLAMAIATDQTFLGVVPRPETRVLYFSARLTAVGLAKHLSVFSENQLVESAERLKIYGRYIRQMFVHQTFLEIAGESKESRKFDVVILDDYQHLGSSTQSRWQFITNLRDWALKTGVRVVVVHQVSASKAANPSSLLLSDELVAAADNVVVLTEVGDNVRVRTFFGGNELRDDLVDDQWAIVGPTIMQKVTGDKAAVEKVLLEATDLLSRTDIKIATGLEQNNVDVALNRLTTVDGKVVRAARGLYRHSTRHDLAGEEGRTAA